MSELKLDSRPRYRGWAPGNYVGTCKWCYQKYVGDKRSSECANCAYTQPHPSEPLMFAPKPPPIPQTPEWQKLFDEMVRRQKALPYGMDNYSFQIASAQIMFQVASEYLATLTDGEVS